MAKSRRLLVSLVGMCMALAIGMNASMVAEADSGKNHLIDFNGGVSAILDPGATNTSEVLNATAAAWNIDLNAESKKAESKLVMANVTNALNVRKEPKADAEKAGKLYKDCGGTILERKDGWTKIQSGDLVGWASDEYLLFSEEAEELASSVGVTVAHIDDGLKVRKEPNTEAGVYGVLPKGDEVEVISIGEDKWACIDYEGEDGYVSTDYISIEFKIDAGETMEAIKEREVAEAEAKRHVNYGEYTTDTDTTMLLAALIQCEAGGESYEGQVAVGAVVMNRVRSAAYPDTIHGVIYASGQFTPAQSGKVNRVLESGKIKQSCIDAANEAISGVSNVGDVTHFRRNNGTREGLVIGNHVFF
ncbi:MAG TPA: cell wall hydrolase [Lachnospiraceae bacterium]|nr:cell wall hydrolase [Lachnospiraceae bacterium]